MLWVMDRLIEVDEIFHFHVKLKLSCALPQQYPTFAAFGFCLNKCKKVLNFAHATPLSDAHGIKRAGKRPHHLL
jgi:hypothetical protein